MAKSRRRFLPIVHIRFQLKYTMLMMLLVFCVTVAFSIYLSGIYDEMIAILSIDSEIAESLAAESKIKAAGAILLLFIVESIILFVIGIRMTNRVVGPIFKMKQQIKEVVEGKYPRMTPLRNGDEFQEIYLSFSDMINALKDQQNLRNSQIEQCLSIQGCPEEIKTVLKSFKS